MNAIITTIDPRGREAGSRRRDSRWAKQWPEDTSHETSDPEEQVAHPHSTWVGRVRKIGAARTRRSLRRLFDETGAATAEYAIATMAAVAFAGLLVVIMQSDEVRGILEDLIRNALTFAG